MSMTVEANFEKNEYIYTYLITIQKQYFALKGYQIYKCTIILLTGNLMIFLKQSAIFVL